MPIPATNIKAISKIDSFRFIKFSFSACFCSIIIILYFIIYRNCVPPFPVRSVLCVFYDMTKIMYSNVAANSVCQSNRLQNRFDYTNYLFQLNTIKKHKFSAFT